jgi:hypothetical protein
MARVRAFSVGGVEMWFYSGDHLPPHFHARRAGEWEVRVFLQEHPSRMIEVVRPPNARLKGRDRRALIEGVQDHRVELLAEW